MVEGWTRVRLISFTFAFLFLHNPASYDTISVPKDVHTSSALPQSRVASRLHLISDGRCHAPLQSPAPGVRVQSHAAISGQR